MALAKHRSEAPAGRGSGRTILSLDSANPAIPAIRARAFVFSDPRSRAMVPLIERTAPSEATVLVTGETGTGKELVARYVHALSDRRSGPFIAVNCGAFSESLIESELFGHERGAFTGAMDARPGWFEAANGGTLFLDEVGDLPQSLQVKLLRILQEREVVRLGSRKPVALDVRLIAATNLDLARAVSEGRFREDLFYRLNVVALPILPLRERRADILPLARHFLELYGTKIGAGRLELTAGAEEALFSHPWPGNIRELENAILRATLTCIDGQITADDLALHALDARPQTIRVAPEEPSAELPAAAADQAIMEDRLTPLVARFLEEKQGALLDRTIESVVRTAFSRYEGNQIRTAAALGVTRSVLRTHLKNFGLI
ncbi:MULTISPECIES: sigma-54 interaction domain-containing protein [Novosphingobium]|jgi:transcriptional regulator with PAS, ATPase and Fis domain|uniref:sigma-54 interaction domain-containing protein n=1 Tax=Novosphingobium TaxID=165696 RepID=UPI0022F24812|nr:sigma 54-interacting transcriptional regulator [Novosphingobium resinovorum]GLK44920.1 Fis family transcriptional regulator [Novosphingobium resinovorum]